MNNPFKYGNFVGYPEEPAQAVLHEYVGWRGDGGDQAALHQVREVGRQQADPLHHQLSGGDHTGRNRGTNLKGL